MTFSYKLTILLIVFIVFFGCVKEQKNKDKPSTNCNESRSELLVIEILRKRFFFDLSPTSYHKDSSLNYNYIYFDNILPQKKEYYAKVDYKFKNVTIDSLKLKVTNDPNKFYMDANILNIHLEKTNIDTSEVGVKITYGSFNKIALNWSSYSFIFDQANCRWIVKDSVFNQY